MDGGQTHGAPGCDRIRRPGVDPLCHGSDPHRCGTTQEVPFHCVQHGDMRMFARIVPHQCGWLGCRVGETNPGPPRWIRRVLSDKSRHWRVPLGVDAWCPDFTAQAWVFRVVQRPWCIRTDSLSCQVTTPFLLCHKNSSLQEL